MRWDASWRVFLLRGGFIVLNLEALKTRLVRLDDLQLHPQPFYTF